MAMVDRYKKNGGFVQLLKVIETCPTKKKQQFMEIIKNETPNWAEAILDKMITFERLTSWNGEVLMEIVSRVSYLPLVTSLKNLNDLDYRRFLDKLSFQVQRKIETTYQEITPSGAEISSSIFKVIGETRDLLVSGVLNADKFDKTLLIPDGIENTLKDGTKGIQIEDNKASISKAGSFLSRGRDLSKQSDNKTQDLKSILSVKSASFDLKNETRPHILKSKIGELTQQIDNLQKINKELTLELEKLKKQVAA